MKCIDELGISPWPWSAVKAVNAECGRSLIVKSSGGVIPTLLPQNARLIAAAPKLYAALYDVFAYCESTHLVPSERFKKVLEKVRAALAEAAGEKEGGEK